MNVPEIEVINRNILLSVFILGMVFGGVISMICAALKPKPCRIRD